MTLHPAVQHFIGPSPAGLPDHLSVVEQRQYMRLLIDLNFLRFSRPGPNVASVTDHILAVDSGHPRCRIYRPDEGPFLPVHIMLHGGGWWQGSVDDLICDAICRQRCMEARLVVIAVEYRLAPEHPFPAALEDAYAVLEWVAEQADELGVNPSNISIGGASAGGNLAAALAIKVRDAGGLRPILQLLEVPALDLTLATAKSTAAADGQDVSDELNMAVARYLADPHQARDPLASPLLAEDLHALPPAVIFTAEYDPLRTEGERYAGRLNLAGVPARVVHHPGAVHGSAMLTRTWEPAAAWQREAAAALRAAHWSHVGAAAGQKAADPIIV